MKYCQVIKDSKLTVTDPRPSIQMIGRKYVNQIQKGKYLIHKIGQHLCVIAEINLSMNGLARQLMGIIKLKRFWNYKMQELTIIKINTFKQMKNLMKNMIFLKRILNF